MAISHCRAVNPKTCPYHGIGKSTEVDNAVSSRNIEAFIDARLKEANAAIDLKNFTEEFPNILYHSNRNGKLVICKAEKIDECSYHKYGKHYDKTTYRAAKLWSEGTDSSIDASTIEVFLEQNPDRNKWTLKPLADSYKIQDIILTPAELEVKKAILEHLEDYYAGGLGLTSVELKNYTSGDHGARGLEAVVEDCIHSTAILKGISDYKVSQDYFRPTIEDGDLDAMRLDQHVWVKGELVALIENRAWIDKPFYELKRNVVQTFEVLPHTKRELTPKTKFLFLGLNIDITNRLIATQDIVYKPIHDIYTIPLSGGTRSSTKGNYFDNGLNDIAVNHFARFLNYLFD